jgi:hypothetical protein
MIASPTKTLITIFFLFFILIDIQLNEKYNAKLTGAKGGGSESDRNHLRPSAAPG